MIHPELLHRLADAIRCADPPLQTHDFTRGLVSRHGSHAELERKVAGWLRTKDPQMVSDGLANVLYWLAQRDGAGHERIYEFRARVTPRMLVEALRLFDWLDGPGLVRIANLELPVFRDLFTVSALRMLLDPLRYACITPGLLELRALGGRSVLHELHLDGGLPPVSLRNEGGYERWCAACRRLAGMLPAESPVAGAAAVERGLGELLAHGQGRDALLLLHAGEQAALGPVA